MSEERRDDVEVEPGAPAPSTGMPRPRANPAPSDPVVAAGELLAEAAWPVHEELPYRVSVHDLYNPEATDAEITADGPPGAWPDDFASEVGRYVAGASSPDSTSSGERGEFEAGGFAVFSLMIRAPVRAVVSGVHRDAQGPIEVLYYADDHRAARWRRLPSGEREFTAGPVAPAFAALLADLPPAPEGRHDTLRLPVDDLGMVRPGNTVGVRVLRRFLARPRYGTTLVDLFAHGVRCAEYPDRAFMLIDNELGRHLLALLRKGGASELVLVRMSAEALLSWLRVGIEFARATR